MLRKKSEAVSEGNGSVHQEEKIGFGQPALADKYQEIRSLSKQQKIMLDRIMRLLEQLSECLEHGARQPRLAMEADGPADTRTRERTEGVATAVQAMRGDGFSARRVEPGPNTNSTSFAVKAEPPALPCRDDVVVESGDAVPESCLSSLEVRSSTAAGGLVTTGEASTATKTPSNEPLLRFYATGEMNPEDDSKERSSWTSIPSASYDSSLFFRLLAAPYCYRVVETKSRQNRTFDPDGSRGHLRACPFWGSWRPLVCGEVIRAGAAGDELQCFFGGDSLALRNKAGFDAVPGKSLAVEGGLRLHELEGGTEITPSKATRADWKRGERLSRSVIER